MIKRDISENLVKTVYLAVGSNLGNKILNIIVAKYKLQNLGIKILKSSSYYETLSWPDKTKPKFINIVLKIETYFSAKKLLEICNKIEYEMGRKRIKKNAPRTCDIDIIDYDQKIIKYDYGLNLILPHTEISKRNFVLLPLFEISKSWKHPISKIGIAKLIDLLSIKDLTAIKQI